MAKLQNQPQEQSTAERAQKLGLERARTSSEMALRASQTQSQQVSPSHVPSKKNVTFSGNSQLGAPFDERLETAPQGERASISKAGLQEAQDAGEKLKNNGLTEVSPSTTKASADNSFDNSAQNGSTMTAMERAKMQAREALQNIQDKKSQSPSTEWER